MYEIPTLGKGILHVTSFNSHNGLARGYYYSSFTDEKQGSEKFKDLSNHKKKAVMDLGCKMRSSDSQIHVHAHPSLTLVKTASSSFS